MFHLIFETDLLFPVFKWFEFNLIFQINLLLFPPLRSEFESRPDLMWENWYFLAVGGQFIAQKLEQLYVLVSSALSTTNHNKTNKVLGVR